MEELYRSLQTKKFIIAGPCVIESEEMVMNIASQLYSIMNETDYLFIFKASFDKANRTSINSFRGPGLVRGLKILEKVKEKFNIPITTDIHESWQAREVSNVIDIIQIPAFLCRQTDLLVEAGKSNKIVNIKKAQFLSGKNMSNPAKKVQSTGNDKIILTERGNSFGYGNLVVDFRNIVDMLELGFPVVFDATHSTQQPSAKGNISGGEPKYSQYLSCAAKSVGVQGLFFEVHSNPKEALSDKLSMLDLTMFKKCIISLDEK